MFSSGLQAMAPCVREAPEGALTALPVRHLFVRPGAPGGAGRAQAEPAPAEGGIMVAAVADTRPPGKGGGPPKGEAAAAPGAAGAVSFDFVT